MDLDPIFDAAAREWNVDPRLLRAVSSQESGGNSTAISRKGAQGLMQITPDTQRYLGITDPNDPQQSIFGAAKYLSEGLDKEGSPEKALLYYHGGPGWRNAYGPESAAYVPGVTKHYQQLAGSQAAPKGEPVASKPDYSDFLKRIGATDEAPAATGKPDYSDFLKRIGATDEAPEAAAEPAADPLSKPDPVTDAEGRVIGPGAEGPADVLKRDMTRIGGAIPKTADEARTLLAEKPGYTASGILPMRVKNDANGQADMSLGIEPDLGPLRGIGNALIDLVDGTRTGKVTPEATNLLAGAAMGGGLLPSVARGTGAAIAETAAYGAPKAALYAKNVEAPANRLTSAAPVAANAAPAGVTADVPAPIERGPNGEPLPRSAGAAASRDTSHPADIVMSPEQVRAYQATAEGQKLLEPQQPGIQDNRAYVQGVTPNAAEIEQDVNTARELKALGTTAPNISKEAKETAAANNDARQAYHQQTIGSPVDVMNLEAARKAQLDKDYPAAFRGAKDADAQPVVEAITGALSDARGKQNTQLNQYIKPLLGRLVDENGALKITNPEELYGFREDLNRMRSKASKASDPNLDHVSGELGDIIAAADAAIEKAAPGYRQYMDNYAETSRAIDEKQVLQGHENKLYDAQNRMTYAKVQTMMRQIVDARSAPGVNPYKSITDATMQRLWNLRDDLRRSASAQELARTTGSDTMQNTWDTAKDLGRIGAAGLAHGAANVAATGLLGAPPGTGSGALALSKHILNPIMSVRTARKQTARGMELLHPKNKLIDLTE